MTEVNETELPGVGLRYDFEPASGPRIGVLVHRSGRRELLVYSEKDPDACMVSVELDEGEARTLSELLGVTRISEHLVALHQEVEGVALEWLTVHAGSAWAGLTLAASQVHTSTGVSVVAIIRGDDTIPAPHSSEVLQVGDVAVCVGTVEGLDAARGSLAPPG